MERPWECRVSVLRRQGGCRRKGLQACEIHIVSGGFFLWELAGFDENRNMRKGVKGIGGGMQSVDGRKFVVQQCSNPRMEYEKARRRWRTDYGYTPADSV